jgi:hypothetical protein
MRLAAEARACGRVHQRSRHAGRTAGTDPDIQSERRMGWLARIDRGVPHAGSDCDGGGETGRLSHRQSYPII